MTGSIAVRLAEYFNAPGRRGVVSAYLFGSEAESRAHRESDVDVGVLFDRTVYPDRSDRASAQIAMNAELIGVLGRNRIDLVVLNDAPPELGRHIVTKGRRVFCSDEASDARFGVYAQLRAAEVAPFLRRAREATLARLTR